ncbi:hypothetical protein [Blastococcus sp. SYSU D00813]
MTGKSLTKLIGFLAFLAVVAGATVAAWDYDTTSSSSRGRGLETIWHGLLALVGQEENATGDMIWIGRGLALVGVALLVLYVVRRVRASRPAGADRPAGQQPGEQHAPEHATQQYASAQHAPQQYVPEQYAPQQYAPQQAPQQPGAEPYAAPQPQPQPQPQQVQWSTGGPQPAPPPAASLSWGAVTSGPTPLPPVPQERPQQEQAGEEQPTQQAPQTRQPDPADMTREVIIPPLPPGWGRG